MPRPPLPALIRPLLSSCRHTSLSTHTHIHTPLPLTVTCRNHNTHIYCTYTSSSIPSSSPFLSSPRHIHSRVRSSYSSVDTHSHGSSIIARIQGYNDTLPQFSPLLQQQITEYAKLPQQGVTLQQLLSFGRTPTKSSLLQSARLLYKELPIRLAKRVRELESLPYGLSQTPAVKKVKGWYEDSFRDLLSIPEPKSDSEEEEFTRLITNIYNRHNDVVPTLAQGVLQMKQGIGEGGLDVVNACPYLQDFLNRFHTSRIGIRLLISQHIAIHDSPPGFIGTVATQLPIIDVIRDAIMDARYVCDKEYSFAPEVDIVDESHSSPTLFVPNHLHHIIFELLKNSMRAVVESHTDGVSGRIDYNMPNIKIIVVDDDSEFSIKISDQGGGIPRNDMERIWTYLYTTTKKSTTDLLNAIQGLGTHIQTSTDYQQPTNSRDTGAAPMSGFGYGLPISRLYARFFGGDLNVVSVHGYGTGQWRGEAGGVCGGDEHIDVCTD